MKRKFPHCLYISGSQSKKKTMECEADLIEFKKPLETSKTLYITGINGRLTEAECQARLKELLDVYGLIYDILVYRGKLNEETNSDTIPSLYAFVKFYSRKAAVMAKSAIHLKYMIDGQLIKVHYAKGKNIDEARKELYIGKCYELANYYLGFNGWTSQVISLSEHPLENEKDVVSYMCNARISFSFHNISSDGVGLGQAAFNSTEILSRLEAIKKAKIVACSRAYENAFSKVKLVVLSSGKVAPVIDESSLPVTSDDLKGVIKINKIDSEPEEVIDEIDWENTTILKDINQQLLIDLELEF